MRRKRSPLRSLGLGAVAAFGIVAAHCGAYLFAPPEPAVSTVHHHAHHAVTATVAAPSAHEHFLTLAALLGAGLVAILSVLVGHFVGRRYEDAPRKRSFGASFAALAILQLVGFATLEIIEFGALDVAAGQSVFWLGLALQIVAALAGTLFLVVFARVATFVAGLRRKNVTRRDVVASFVSGSSRIAIPALRMIAGGLSFRGPPVFSL